MTRHRTPDLARASLLYLALPNAIFLLGWLHWWIGIPAALLLTAACFRPVAGSRDIPVRGLLLAAVAALVVLLQSGVGGFGPQDADWLKHNVVLMDLIRRPWPAVYDVGGDSLALVYYIAYYLPAALAGKLLGWQVANLALFAWSWLGLVLALVWFQALVGRAAVWGTVLFLAFSGLDAVGMLFWKNAAWRHLEWWAGHWSYQSPVTQLWWVPQIALGGWIATALIVDSVEQGRARQEGLLLLGLTPLFSPFITVGVAAYLAWEWLRQPIREVLTPRNYGGLALLLLFVLYFTAKFPEETAVRGFIFSVPLQAGPATWSGIALLMTAFCLLEFGAFGLLIGTSRQGGRLLGVTMALLLALPFFRYGYYNDLAMRASIPALFVLAVLVGREVLHPETNPWRRRLLVLLLVIGSLTPLVEWRRHAERIQEQGSIRFLPPEPPAAISLPTVHRRFYAPAGIPFLRQYTGSPDAPFFRYLARRTTPE